MTERRRNTTGRSGVVVGRWRSKPQVVGSTPATPFSFSDVDVGDAFQFINHTAQRGDKKLQVFKTIGRGFAPTSTCEKDKSGARTHDLWF